MQSRLENTEKLEIFGIQDDEKINKNRKHYVLDTTMCHFRFGYFKLVGGMIS